LSEVIFGLLMALSFTGTMSAAVGGGEEVRGVLFAALGCNVAWGIVDGVMFVLATAVERARRARFLKNIRSLPLLEARRLLLQEMPEALGVDLNDEEAGALLARVRAKPAVSDQTVIVFDDVRAAVLIFVLVVTSTLPPSLPFLFISELHAAMRVSNAVALVMLFVIGAQLGRYMGGRRWPMALAMTSIGSVLVAVTIALGG
jgi:hypothetical protein